MIFTPNAEPLREANSCHTPAGSPQGGQFCSKPFQRREDAIGPWTEESFNDGSHRRREKAWVAGIKRALTFGRLSLGEAKQLGFHTSITEDDVGPLPDVLYHVTTNADAVLKGRLKTRAELAQTYGLGLGGGDDDTISFTTDPKIAEDIYAGMHLMRDVAAGDISGRQLKAWALGGDKAGRRFWDDIVRSWGGRTGTIELALDGFVPFSSENPTHRAALDAQMRAKAPELSTAAGVLGDAVKALGWRLAPGAGSWDTAARGRMYAKTDVWVPGTAQEQRDVRVDLAKKFLFWREQAGGPTDPLFFLSDTAALGRKSKSDFAILTVRPRQGAIGHRVSGLKEWRTWHGAAVRVESARRP